MPDAGLYLGKMLVGPESEYDDGQHLDFSKLQRVALHVANGS